MSGPKVDIATIREQEMMKLAAAREGRKNLFDKIQRLLNQVSNCLGDDLDLMMQDDSLRPSCERILKMQDDCCRELRRMLGFAKSGNEMLNIEEMSAKSQQIVAKFNESIQADLALVGQMSWKDCGYDIGDDTTLQYKTTGCTRTGCMLCGFGCHLEDSPTRFERLHETHPKMYNLLDVVENNGITYREAIDWTNEHGNLDIKY